MNRKVKCDVCGLFNKPSMNFTSMFTCICCDCQAENVKDVKVATMEQVDLMAGEIRRIEAINVNLLMQIERSKCCVNCKYYSHGIMQRCKHKDNVGPCGSVSFYHGCNLWRLKDAA